jgi:outer membrane protein assembly factor BamA
MRRYIPVLPDHKLALSSLLTLTTGSVGRNLAAWQQFALGGTNSIRGWQLGSRTGKNQLINTIEYRYNIVAPRPVRILGFGLRLGAQIALFSDFGHAWNSSPEFKTSNFIGGYGVGFRALVPFTGIVRVDLAVGGDNRGIRLHLGSFEKAYKQRRRVR